MLGLSGTSTMEMSTIASSALLSVSITRSTIVCGPDTSAEVNSCTEPSASTNESYSSGPETLSIQLTSRNSGGSLSLARPSKVMVSP